MKKIVQFIRDENIRGLASIREEGWLNNADFLGMTPLMAACYYNSPAIVEHIISRGADLNARCTAQLTALHYAVLSGEHDISQDESLFLEESPGEYRLTNYAINSSPDNNELFRMARGNYPSPEKVSVEKKKEIIRILSDAGADMNPMSLTFLTPLYCAVMNSEIETADELLKCAASFTSSGMNPADYINIAIINEDEETLKFILSKNPEINLKDRLGGTPLALASGSERINLTKLLLKAGADPELPGHNNMTPLMCAVLNEDEEMIRLLIENGADPAYETDEGASALEYAEGYDKRKAVAVLKEYMEKR